MEVFRYQRPDGTEPFSVWLGALRDKMAAARIRIRLRQVEAGNFGDSVSVGSGVVELRIHVGAGYRVYCGRHGKAVVILLSGGDKSTQPADIARAKEFGRSGSRGRDDNFKRCGVASCTRIGRTG